MRRLSTVFPFQLDRLEPRRLLAYETWGDAERLVRLPDAIDAFATQLPLDGAGQTIAIIDSGIDYTHPSLGGGFGPGFKVVGGYDFVDDDADPFDTFGHGTEVAGVLAADEYVTGELTHRGIAPAAQLVALRIDSDGLSSVPDSRIEQALQWCLANRTQFGITVINISYGSGSYTGATVSSVYGDEIQLLTDAGVSIVAASGNGGYGTPGIDTPAADPNVISVGSVNLADRISSFSERGPALDLLAPGESVYTTYRFGGFGPVDGTSFAAPMVAGTVALMRSLDPGLRPADVHSILVASGIPNFDGDTELAPTSDLTYSRLDVLGALQLTNARLPASPAEQDLLGQYGNGNAISVDKFGVTHFVYYDSLANTMRYSTRSTAGVWSKLQYVDNELAFQGYYLSLAIDNWGRPSVAYFDGTHGDLKYARFDGIRWSRETIDIKNSTGLYPSLAFDAEQSPVISYYRKTTGDLRVARKDAQGIWRIEAVDTEGDVGRDTSLDVDSSGRIGVAYADSGTGFLKFAIFSPRIGTWANVAVDKSTSRVSFLSMKFDAFDNPVVSYYDSGPADLKVARFFGRKWTNDKIATKGAVGLYTNFFFNQNLDLQVLYYNKSTTAAYVASGNVGSWTITKILDGGRYLATATDRINQLCRFTYYDTASGRIKIDQLAL